MSWGPQKPKILNPTCFPRDGNGTVIVKMKLLNGAELALYIKERQAKQVRALRQAEGIQPKLAIIKTIDDPVINTYVKLKKRYGADILIDVDIYDIDQTKVPNTLKKLNADKSVHGIIIQLPLANPDQTEELVAQVAPEKDVDALGPNAKFDPATPLAILWLLSGYNIDLPGINVLLLGRGKLVGTPLARMLKDSGIEPVIRSRRDGDFTKEISEADVIITATGAPHSLTAEHLKKGTVVVDAGVASESGKTVGDVAPEVYERDDLTITPTKGGVGPLTVCALFDNVITAARRTAKSAKK